MTIPATVWLLNFDAEVELGRMQAWLDSGRPVSTLSYATAKPVQQLIDSYAPRFAALLPQNAVVVKGNDPLPAQVQGYTGLCWCPTPSAIQRLGQLGARPIAAPDPAVLLRVNQRSYCAELGQTLPEARFVTTLDEMNALLSRPSPSGRSPKGQWLCKRPLGFAGRGQRRIAAEVGARAYSRADNQRWLQESLPHGGLQIEPYVSLVAEFSLHGLVRRDGGHSLGQVCQQQVDEHRAWASSIARPSQALTDDQVRVLRSEAERVASALAREGYFGPFSVDSYVWQDVQGATQLNPRSEINARLTMGYPTGMGEHWLSQLLMGLAT